jgi:hypothetical protein
MNDDFAELLEGGGMSGAVRVGDTVRRPSGAWTPTIQRLLGHLRGRGIGWVPEPLGFGEDGRDKVTYLAGLVPRYPLPGWIWSDATLVRAAQYLVALHDASTDFDTTNAEWQIPAHHPVEVVCHNDFAPYNMVFRAEQLAGVIDWDTASPGPRVWDLAYLAYRLVPLVDPGNRDGLDNACADRARRLRLLCSSYGHRSEPSQVLSVAVQRLHDLAGFTEARAAGGRAHLRDHVVVYRRDAAWIGANTDALRLS